MKISVITVCLNAKDVIEKTFKSVINQTYKDWEFVVFDGVSTDGTLDIIEKYKEYIAVFQSQKDGGIYDAMNKALKCALGDYLIFLNAGDTLYDDRVFERVAAKIKEQNNPDFAFGYANYTGDDSLPDRIDKYPRWRNKYFFANFCMCHQCIFYKKELFNDSDYDTSFLIYADWEFNTKCAVKNKAKICNLGFCISNYDTKGFSSRKENFKIIREERKRIQKKYFKNIYPFLALDNFLVKNFNSLYRPIRRVLVGYNL